MTAQAPCVFPFAVTQRGRGLKAPSIAQPAFRLRDALKTRWADYSAPWRKQQDKRGLPTRFNGLRDPQPALAG